MIALPPFETMLTTYPDLVDNSQERFRKRFHGIIEQTKKFQAQWEEAEPTGDDAIQIEVKAAENMARDLSYFRENARNVADGIREGRFATEIGIKRTNGILGELTGLRSFFRDLAQSSLTNVEHARLDVRVEVLQEEIATACIRSVDIAADKAVIFDPSNGGLRFKD
jgi:hypothetical protein